ncbi:DUF402 domain-containing protein [Paenibacillus sp. GYB003]|uniref:DUF402 domain-containing protein n=1 Tax=Paenibacillus sp. GYB003 TaxID=2994392 RepID=UPI002F963030
MKRKIADRPNWTRIVRKRYYQEDVRDDVFEGKLALLRLDEVREPLYVTYGEHRVCIVDHGHAWLMFFPEHGRYSLTVMLDRNNNVLQSYFDIVRSIQTTEDGIPVIEDLYLDLVVLPSGQYFILDEDELAAALAEGAIDEQLFHRATNELEMLRVSIAGGEHELIANMRRYLRFVEKYK